MPRDTRRSPAPWQELDAEDDTRINGVPYCDSPRERDDMADVAEVAYERWLDDPWGGAA